MGPRPEERTTPPNGIEEDVVESESDTNARDTFLMGVWNLGTTEQDPETTNSTEAWARAEGYTPLSDLNNDGGFNADNFNSYVMVSTGPGDGSGSEDESDDDPWERAGAGSGAFFVNPSAFGALDQADAIQPNEIGNVGEDEFEEIAASALSTLDKEYQQTLGFSQGSASKSNSEDDDLKIIAAGFDQRKHDQEQIREQGGFIVHQWEDSETKPSADGAKTDPQNDEQWQAHKSAIDTDAVRKAIQTLSVKNKNAPFQQKFAAWQQNLQRERNDEHDSAIDSHALIPKASYHEFQKSKPTSKSRLATAEFTRSATLAEALARLSLLSSLSDDSLLIDVVGVDHVECQSASTIRNTFRPIVRWVRDYFFYTQGRRTVRLHFRLIGRELTPMTMANGGVVDLLESSSSSMRATATCHSGVYHEFLEERRQSMVGTDPQAREGDAHFTRIAPDLAIAYNAGIWGYQEWATTIQYLAKLTASSSPMTTTATTTTTTTKESVTETDGRDCDHRGIPMVITAYTLDECQEDQEVISEAIAALGTDDGNEGANEGSIHYRAEILWESEWNPFGSQVTRETKGSTQEYRENACWQAWLLGGSDT